MDFVLQSHNSDWLSFVIIGCTLVLGLFHYLRLYSFKESFALSFGGKPQTQKEDKTNIAYYTLSIIALLLVALYLSVASQYLGFVNELSFVIYLRFIFFQMFLIGIQKFLLNIHAFTSGLTTFFKEYVRIQTNIIQFATFLTLPFLWGALFIPYAKEWLLAVGMGLFVLIYSFSIVKTIGMSNRIKGSNKVHIILYLCGNEILPLLLLYKLLI